MISENNKYKSLVMWVLFLIYPLGSFIISIKKYNNKRYRIFILLFLMLFGYTFIPIPESDGDFYKNNYLETEEYTFKNYTEDLQLMYDGRSINPDIYIETIKYISFLFSNNYKFFFLLVALVYFFVALKLIGSIWDIVIEKETGYYLAFFIGIVTIFNIGFGLNGIRFPLAFWVFSYGAFNLIVRKDKLKYLVIALLASLIHFSLLYLFIYLFIFYFLKIINDNNDNNRLLYIILIITVIFSQLFPMLIASYIDFFGETYTTKMITYTDENYIAQREEHVKRWNWYVQFNQVSMYYFCIATLLLTKSKFFNIRVDKISNNLFSFSILLLISSILSGTIVDSISNRYYLVFNLFALIYLFYLSSLNYYHSFLRISRIVFFPILILHILISFRIDLYTINSTLVFGNAVIIFLMDSSTSIYDVFFL